MAKIGVFFKLDGEMAYPFNSLYFFESYKSLAEIFIEKGYELYILRGKDNYLGDGVFKKYWLFENGGLVQFNKEVKIDVIYDKGRFPFEDMKVLGGKKLNDLCVDKYKIYDLFPELSPKSVLVWSLDAYRRELDKYKDDELVVVKPNFGASGKGITIDKKKSVSELIPEEIDKGYLVQEFMDCSCGIEGVVEGVHDLRIVFLNGEVLFGIIRIPKEGTLIANYSLGGSYFVIEKSEIPKEFIEVVMDMYEVIFKNDFEKVHVSFDLMMTKNGIRLIEINSSPGLPNKLDDVIGNYYEKLVGCLIEMANSD